MGTEETLFHEALERTDPQERTAFLDQSCASQPELRAAVEALLAASRPETSILDKPALSVATLDAVAETVTEGPGTVIDPYQLVEQIGEGGFGVVFRAEQQQPIRRQVALKTIKPGMDTRQVVARFETERQALALMEHPNIARVLDGGVTGSGRPYFVMELVPGIPITEYCDERQLTPRERLALFIPVCQAVQHAHQKGIIHRDLKPSNVLVAEQDGIPVPKVIDFGVAKALGQPLSEQTLATGLGRIIGTLEYMSPEQAEFHATDVDTRADIYSLGVLLYELLTGTTPLTKDRLRQAAVTELLRVIREEEPPRPSTRLTDSKDMLASVSAQRKLEPARLTKAIRGELDWIVMKCLEKDRNRRYATANGLVRDIERYLNEEPVEAGPPSAGYKLRKLLRRNRGPVAAATLVLMALVAGIAGTTTEMIRAERERHRASAASDQARRNLTEARRNLDLAVAAVDQFCTKVSEDPRLKEHDLRPLRQNLLKSAVEFHQELLSRRHQSEIARIDLARSQARLAQLTNEIDASDQAIIHYQRAVQLYGEVLNSQPADMATQCELARNLVSMAELYTVIGRSDEAEQSLRRGLDILKSILSSKPQLSAVREQLARALAAQGYTRSLTGRPSEAQTSWREAIVEWERLAQESPDNARYASELAHARWKLGDAILGQGIAHWREAQTEYRTALKIARGVASQPEVSDFEHRVLANILLGLAKVEMVSGQNPDAIQHIREAIDTLERLREEQPSVRSHLHDLATAYMQLGKCEQLANRRDAYTAAFSQAAELEGRLVAQAPGNAVWESLWAELLGELGFIARDDGDSQSALKYFDHSKQLSESILAREPESKNVKGNLPYVLSARGRLLAGFDRFQEALADCDQAVLLSNDQEDKRDNFRLDRAWVRMMAGDYPAAASEARDSLDALASRCDIRFLPPRFVFGARICSRAAALAQADVQRTADETARLSAEYSAAAIDMLHSALDGGLSDATVLEEEEFQVLADRPEFLQIQEELSKRGARQRTAG